MRKLLVILITVLSLEGYAQDTLIRKFNATVTFSGFAITPTSRYAGTLLVNDQTNTYTASSVTVGDYVFTSAGGTYVVDTVGAASLFSIPVTIRQISGQTAVPSGVGDVTKPSTNYGLFTFTPDNQNGVSSQMQFIKLSGLVHRIDSIFQSGGNGLISALPLGSVTIDANGNTLRLDTINTFTAMYSATAGITKGRTSYSTMASTPRNDINNGLVLNNAGGAYLHFTNGTTAGNVQAFTDRSGLRAWGATQLVADIEVNATNTVHVRSYNPSSGVIESSVTLNGKTMTIDADSIIKMYDIYNLPNATPPSDGTPYVMSWTNNTPSFSSAVAASTYDAGNGAFVTATGGGVTFSRTDGVTGTFTIPAGVELLSGSIHHSSAQNPGSVYYIRFDFQGSRATNTGINTLSPPIVRVINKYLAAPSRTNPATFDSTSGTINLTARVTGVSPLEMKLENYNNSVVGGSQETMIKFVF
jgi:hypothetical protein